MKIVSVDPFYLRVPQITAAADGTQDTLLVRIRTDEGLEGWGECDASPLVSLSAYCCPMSHGNMISVRDSLAGEEIDTVDDIYRLHAKVLKCGGDIGQIHHAYSAADIALWDLLGKRLNQPVWRLLGGMRAFPKLPYASLLFGDTPEDTRILAEGMRSEGYQAVKFGWGPMGQRDAEWDVDLVKAAREGVGPKSRLMIDAGWAWKRDVDVVSDRIRLFAPYGLTWLEEPLDPEAIAEYAELARRDLPIPIAGGENSATFRAAEDYVEQGRVDFIQIDAGRIGGITTARRVVELALKNHATYVNHTFKSRLSLAAALHVFADVEAFEYLEYPARGSELAQGLASGALDRDRAGRIRVPEAPGLGVTIEEDCVRKFCVPVRIELADQVIHETPDRGVLRPALSPSAREGPSCG